ncbi:MAG: FAD-dependent monooxygenase [Paracoccaceae bacterium]
MPAPDAIRAEVAVVGGGLVGPALALALARLGLSVALVERTPEARRREPGFDGRAYAVALASARALDALGLWADLEPLAAEVRAIRVGEGRTDAQGAGLLGFDPRALDEGRMAWILEDRWLRRALLDAAGAEPGIESVAPATVVAADLDGPCARLDLADGRTVEAAVAVAADGRRSALAAMGGIGRQVFPYAQTGLVCAIEHEREHHGLAWQSFFPGGPFAVLPLPGRRSQIVWSERDRAARRLAALDDGPYTLELARRLGPRLGPIRLAGERHAYPLDLVLADAYVRPRLALAGDAAHGVHPIAGQGFNLGMRDVAALAETLAEAARRGEDPGSALVLGRYQTRRRFDNVTFALGMDALDRLFSNAVPLVGPLRRLGLGLVDASPGLKRRFMREAAGIEGALPAMLKGAMP